MPERLKDKLVLITGASSGIGEACAKAFAEAGAHLILAARRKDKLEVLARQLAQDYSIKTYVYPLDVADKQAVLQLPNALPSEWRAIDILVNNAGLALGFEPLQHGSYDDWDTMIDTNVKGLLYITRALLPGMIERNRGHVINIGSIAGREAYQNGNVYIATKHAVRALNKAMKMDLLGTSIRVSSVDPGLVNTEFSAVRFKGDQKRADNVYRDMQPLVAGDIADAVVYCASRPPHVNISEMLVLPTDQAAAHLVSRKSEE